MNAALEVVGFGLIVASAYFIHLALALFVAGSGLIVFANAPASGRRVIDRPRREHVDI